MKQPSSTFGFILSQVKPTPERKQTMRQQRNINTIAAAEKVFQLQRL